MPSSAIITQRSFAFVPSNVVVFSGEYKRQIKMRGDWQRIRIGMLCAITPNGTANLSSHFIFGMCAGNEGYGSNVTDYFIGASLIGPITDTTRTLTYNAGSANNPFYQTAGTAFVKKVENELTSFYTNNNTLYLPTARTGYYMRRAPIYLDYTRPPSGSGIGTITLYALPYTSVQLTDIRTDHFIAGFDQVGVPTINGQTCSTLSTYAQASFSEMNGPLDTINLLWSRESAPLEVSALGAIIYAPSYEVYSKDGPTGAYDSFNKYAASPSSTAITSDILNKGYGWASNGTISGNCSNPNRQFGFAGSSCGFPAETFESYATGAVTVGALSSGIGWAGPFVTSGTASTAAQTGLGGGASSVAADAFDTYAVGSVTSGVTLSGGSGWADVGKIV